MSLNRDMLERNAHQYNGSINRVMRLTNHFLFGIKASSLRWSPCLILLIKLRA